MSDDANATSGERAAPIREGFSVGPKTLVALLSLVAMLAGAGGSKVGFGSTSAQLETISRGLEEAAKERDKAAKERDKAAEERKEATAERVALEKRLSLIEQTRYTRDDAARDRAELLVAINDIKLTLAGLGQKLEAALKERR